MKYKQKNETLNNEFDSKKKHSRKIEGFRCNYFPQKQTEFMQRKREKERPEECEERESVLPTQSTAEIECETRMRPNLGFCTQRKSQKKKNGLCIRVGLFFHLGVLPNNGEATGLFGSYFLQ